MGKVLILDCTLRDGGYINNWEFGEDTIKGFSKKIAQTGIAFFEVGFLKSGENDPNKTLYPNIKSIEPAIFPKQENMRYVAMLTMEDPIPLECISPFDGNSIDGIRVIFKKDKADKAVEYCKKISELGYFFTANLVRTDDYDDDELASIIRRFGELKPFAVSVVDTFGVINKKEFLRLIEIADNNLHEEITLAYHAHNNMQQAFGNAEELVELGLKRDILIDASVFGMGRGAGNLNLELFAQYMNEYHAAHYRIEPMLEIMDEYLYDIYRTKFWGYSVPMFLSAATDTHPNYAAYYGEKGTLTVRSFNELLKTIDDSDKSSFSLDKAEKYYKQYMASFIDDRETVEQLSSELGARRILVLAPGHTLNREKEKVLNEIAKGAVVIAANFTADEFKPDYVFSSNMRRFSKIQGKTNAKCIITSNMKEATQKDYIINYASYISEHPEIIDNSVLMLLKLLNAAGIKEVLIAGMDGYATDNEQVYYNRLLHHDFSKEAVLRNKLISEELSLISQRMNLKFITETVYDTIADKE